MGILAGYSKNGKFTGNAYVCTDNTQKGANNANPSGKLEVSTISKGTILGTLGDSSKYVSSDDYPLYPRLKDAKY